jgi:hypothetical protein
MWSRTIIVVLVLSIAAFPGGAHAEGAADARALFQSGVELFQGGDYAAAAGAFRASYEASPAPIALLNLAMCQRELFQYVESIDTLEQVLAHGAEALPPDQAAAARRFIEEMTALLGTVRVAVEPADATVTVDEQEVPPAQLANLRLRAGPHRVAARAAGHEDAADVVQVVAQRVNEVRLVLAPIEGPADAEPLDGPQDSRDVTLVEAPEPARPPVHRRWGFWLGMLGAAAAVGLGVGLGVGLSQDNETPGADLVTRLP